MEAALAVFTERPYADVTLADIAAAADVTVESLRGRFATKQELYLAAVEAAAAALVAATRIDPALEPLDRLERGLEAFLDHALAHRAAYIALMRDAVGADERVRAAVDETRERLRERIFVNLCADSRTERMRTKLRGWIANVEAATLDWLEQGGGDRKSFLGAARRSLLLAKDGTHLINPIGVP